MLLIKNAFIVNEGTITEGDVLTEGKFIKETGKNLRYGGAEIIDAKGKYLLPGAIDDQVHFREPGLIHKATIHSESRAAIAGGITSFMEMPNTIPNTLTHELLEEKYKIASESSLANYSFFLGASNDNFEEILKTDPRKVCGIKIFMGSSTGNMLVDSRESLERIFSECKMLIATHCEDEKTIRDNFHHYKEKYGEQLDATFHPLIRSAEACYISSSFAVGLAKKYNTRLHILHISTEKETSLFDNSIPLKEKRITSEACVHHLWFSDKFYPGKGNFIKWNPAIKTEADRDAILKAVLDNRIDIIATDHAPHTHEEKSLPYLSAPSGGPLVQHALPAMLELFQQGKISIEKVVEKMCHAPADCFQVEKRGYIRENYFADLVLVDLNNPWTVTPDNLLYKCRWSPFEGTTFHSKITHTIINGNISYANGIFNETNNGMRLSFQR
jgi:dihydroorotase